jgi:hypothetical protein
MTRSDAAIEEVHRLHSARILAVLVRIYWLCHPRQVGLKYL